MVRAKVVKGCTALAYSGCHLLRVPYTCGGPSSSMDGMVVSGA
ncbi:hypothetical protein GQ55_7G157600 [Panicum hallii var. hallii]|uniref:Uncharacterized protein n=1 Tax=Panicum hallii var. hallii TaxID=1504633 RepID=A0A2T7CVK1_9POAL|nr:hypothetical protein GQ55_7G157600 [Panicum hallii var. hallii]